MSFYKYDGEGFLRDDEDDGEGWFPISVKPLTEEEERERQRKIQEAFLKAIPDLLEKGYVYRDRYIASSLRIWSGEGEPASPEHLLKYSTRIILELVDHPLATTLQGALDNFHTENYWCIKSAQSVHKLSDIKV